MLDNVITINLIYEMYFKKPFFAICENLKTYIFIFSQKDQVMIIYVVAIDPNETEELHIRNI